MITDKSKGYSGRRQKRVRRKEANLSLLSTIGELYCHKYLDLLIKLLFQYPKLAISRKSLFMFVFIEIILVMRIILSQQVVTLLNSSFPTLDNLGYVLNKAANTAFNLEPTPTYQVMLQYPNGTVECRYSIDNNPPDWTKHVDPSIILHKMKRRANFRNKNQLYLNINVQSPIDTYEYFLVYAVVYLAHSRASPYPESKIEIYVLRNYHPMVCNSQIALSGATFCKFNNTFYYINNISNAHYQGTLDLDQFVSLSLSNGYLFDSDIITDIRISGQMTTGGNIFTIDYEMKFDTMVYMDPGVIGIVQGYTLNLNLNVDRLALGQYLEVQAPRNPSKIQDMCAYYNVGSTDTTLKGFYEVRVGYYEGTWLTPRKQFGLPVDSTTTDYIATYEVIYNGESTSSVGICWVLRSYTVSATQNLTSNPVTELHVCPYWKNIVQPQGVFIESIIITDQQSQSHTFQFYEITNTTSTQPFIFLFASGNNYLSKSSLNLFKFIKKLMDEGKILATELFAGLSLCFRVYSGNGSFSVTSVNLAVKDSLCQNGYYLNNTICVPCNSSQMEGCVFCNVPRNCLACNASYNWTLGGGKCVCLIGNYLTGSNQLATCNPCAMPGCLACVSNTNCTTCDLMGNWLLVSDNCVCQSGYYVNGSGSTVQCSLCSQSIAGCNMCSNPSTCLACDVPGNWNLNSNICVCANGYYLNNQLNPICVVCTIVGCNTCISLTACIQCNTTANFILSAGTCICSMGYYLDGVNCSLCAMFQCLACVDQSTCTQCNSAANFVLSGGQCMCPTGYILSSTNICWRVNSSSPDNTTTSNETQKGVCSSLDSQLLEPACRTQISQAITSIIMNVVSVPDITILAKVSQIYSFIEDFTYFLYHNMYYGAKFKRFTQFMWNLTRQRLAPSVVASVLLDTQTKYHQLTISSNTSYIPFVWTRLGEGATFVNTSRDFWLTYIPCTCTVFLLVNLLYRLLVSFKFGISKAIISFKWFSILFTSIVTQNIQYVAFRCFQQILFGGTPTTQSPVLYLANQLACYVVLFIVIVYSCCGHVILRVLIGSNVKYALELVIFSREALFFLALTQLLKVLNSFFTVCFYFDNLTQVFLILGRQIFVLLVVVSLRNCFRSKSLLALLVSEYIARTVAHIFLFLRACWKYAKIDISHLLDEKLDDYVMTSIYLITLITCVQVLILFAIPTKTTDNKTPPKQNKTQVNLLKGTKIELTQKNEVQETQANSLNKLQKPPKTYHFFTLKSFVKAKTTFDNPTDQKYLQMKNTSSATVKQ